jgi:hypothetical protein
MGAAIPAKIGFLPAKNLVAKYTFGREQKV